MSLKVPQGGAFFCVARGKTSWKKHLIDKETLHLTNCMARTPFYLFRSDRSSNYRVWFHPTTLDLRGEKKTFGYCEESNPGEQWRIFPITIDNMVVNGKHATATIILEWLQLDWSFYGAVMFLWLWHWRRKCCNESCTNNPFVSDNYITKTLRMCCCFKFHS